MRVEVRWSYILDMGRGVAPAHSGVVVVGGSAHPLGCAVVRHFASDFSMNP